MNPLLLEVPDEIATPRLLLRAPRAGEAEEMHQAVMESLNELKPWMPWANPDPTLESTRVYCQGSIARHASREEISYRIRLRETDLYLGNVTLPRPNWNVPRLEIGYWMRSSQTGHGFMTEAVQALAAFSLETLKAARVEIHCDQQNTRSRRVAERAGFELEGVLRNQFRGGGGRLGDMCMYSRIAGF